MLDPRKDGWDTESLAKEAKVQLGRISKLLACADSVDAEDLGTFVAPKFTCGQLRPTKLKEVFRDRAIVVRRSGNSLMDDPVDSFRGPQGLAEALNGLADALQRERNVRVKFKVVRIEPSSTSIRTSAYYEASSRTPRGTVQQNAVWDARWRRSSEDESLRLVSVRVHDFEEVVVHCASQTLFADCTEAVLGANAAYRDQLRFGVGYWSERLEKYFSRPLIDGHIGMAVGDVNGDSLTDVYVCQPAGLPNRLFLQNGDGTVREASSQAGVDIMDISYSTLLLDLDNDGDQDLVVLTSDRVLIFANDGRGTFSLKAPIVGYFEYSVTAADYDNDGDLDLYVCRYSPNTGHDITQFGSPFPIHNARNGGRNMLLRNDGNWTFTDATDESGIGANNDRWSYAAAWEDYNNDGYVDLYVANDYGHNNLYRNDAGRFTDVAEQTGTVDANLGMSVAWGDYNRDGWMDLYISNMFSAAGNRVTFQERFKPEESHRDRSAYQLLARGNTLLENAGDGTFRDVSVHTGLTMGRWAWSSLFVDINNDGWEDVLVSNGYLTQDTADDL